MQPRLSYRPVGEEVDGSIWFHGRTILIEAKWTQDPHPASSLYQFRGKVDGKLIGTLGLFISMAGFSTDAVDALVAGKELNLVLADGDDVRAIVNGTVTIGEALMLKIRAAGDSGTPFVPLRSTAATRASLAASNLLLVEGAFDLRVLEALREMFGASRNATIIPAGGPGNMGPLIHALVSTLVAPARLTIMVDDDGLTGRAMTRIEEAVADVKQHADSVEIEIVKLVPDLDAVVGLVEPGAQWQDRRRLREISSDGLADLLSRIDIAQRLAADPLLATVLKAIGIDTSQLPDRPGRRWR